MAIRSRVPRPPAALLFPPPVLCRRYALEGEIGQGGYARVFRAWDAQTAKTVALKRAHLGHHCAETLLHEAAILSGLQHPGIPAFLETFEEDGFCYLVEEWKAGSSLKEQRFFSLPTVLWIGQRCCDVLTYIHQCEVCHGDLTPGNVLLANRACSLIDFGLAHRPGDSLRPRGTPGYASPEQWRDGLVSQAGDIFSLGMLLGCALTDTVPEEVQRARSFLGLWDDPCDRPTELTPLLTLLDRMIAASPASRPALAEVQRQLLHLEQQLPVDLRCPRPPGA